MGRVSTKPRVERDTRNRRTVWRIASQPLRDEHFAPFPEALVEPCILAGSRPGDTVRVPAGTYQEHLWIDKPVTLVADGSVTIDGGGSGDIIEVELSCLPPTRLA
jgi:nitrous oxidase accessory protein NosD